MPKTLAEITLEVAREITEVLDGTATAGTDSSITDTNLLIQQAQYWDRGTVWITSGTHDGKIARVTGFAQKKLSFAAFASSVGLCQYSVARDTVPWHVLVQMVNRALGETFKLDEDASHLGDGETLDFTLPVGVYNIARVEIENAGDATQQYPNHRWDEVDETLKFDPGYPPADNDIIHIFFKADHAWLKDYNDEIQEGIKTEWVKWKACEHALYWMLRHHSNLKELRVEELMNKVMGRLKKIKPRKPNVRVKIAG